MKVLLLLLLPILLASCSGKSPESKSRDGKPGAGKRGNPSVAVYVVKPIVSEQMSPGLGTVIAAEKVEIKSEATGKVSRILFQEGQRVEQGQVLVQIADEELQANRSRALAKKSYAESVLERKKKQKTLETISAQDLELAEADFAAAEAELRIWDAQIAKTQIKAPFTGVTGFRMVSPGALVNSGTVLTSLVQRNPVRIEFSLQESQAGFLKIGSEVEVRGPDGLLQSAVLQSFEGVLDETSHSMKARALVRKSVPWLPGSAVEVKIPSANLKGNLIPPDALSGSIEGPLVYLLKAGKTVQKPVKLGLRTPASVHVTEGLAVGDSVICAGAQNLKSGQPVVVGEVRE